MRPVFAQVFEEPIPKEAVQLDPIKIEAPKNKKNASSIPLNKDINHATRTLSEALEKEQGVRIQRLGAPGSYSTLSIRGLSPNQSGIYIDGVELNDPLEATFNLENLPIQAFESVSIERNSFPIEMNGLGLGGALNLVPISLEENQKKVFIDSYLSSLVGGSIGVGVILPWTLQYLNFETSKNTYRYVKNNGTPNNLSDDTIVNRENEGFTKGAYISTYQFKFNKNTIKILLELFSKERGLSGSANTPYFQLKLKEQRGLLKVAHQLTEKNITWNNTLAYYVSTSDVIDSAKELYISFVATKRLNQTYELSTTPNFYFLNRRLHFTFSLFALQTLIQQAGENYAKRLQQNIALGLTFREKKWGQWRFQSKNSFFDDEPLPNLFRLSLYPVHTERKKIHLHTYEARYSFFPLDFSINSPKLDDDERELELYISYAKTARAPSLIERYGDTFLTIPNFEIKGENGVTSSIGLQSSLQTSKNKMNFNFVYFQTWAKDLIQFYQIAERAIRAENISVAEINGVELKIKYEYETYFLGQVSFTILNALDKGSLPFYHNKKLPFQPHYSTSVYIESGFKQIRPWIDVHYFSMLYRDRQNSFENYQAERLRADLGLSCYIEKNARSRISFVVKNILNSYQYDILGYPLPDRSYEIQFYKEFDFM